MADPGHPAIPLRLDPATADPETGVGTFATVPQDSLAEVRQCTRAILLTRIGLRIENPELGITDPRFGTSVDADEIADVLDQFEDRAEWDAVADPDTGAIVGVRVTGTA
ncbi:unannotated protein [freshwater metagenome]|uniref:Unannotated protein n=1 Tax=freshwater metagenome TaxID=449393 RepID=A0A6J7FTJ0_9ZZZZ|nr:hypothetical protein [Actinomycetota bacterium]